MPKPKQFLRENKKNGPKASAKAPESADEYLEAGVEFEEAGEKWRGGDAEKSMRFFGRAINTYDEGLGKFPKSFDLAYNKARVQYELTQHPKLAARLAGPLPDLLRTALVASRYALHLNQDNADVLFNTAQVLRSLAEALADVPSGAPSKEDGLPLLEEALELFQRCLTVQEFQYTQAQAQAQAQAQGDAVNSSLDAPMDEMSDTEDGGASLTDSQLETDERWATIVEQVTTDTLLDTILAQIDTLTTLCGLVAADEGRALAWTQEYSTSLLKEKIPAYVQGADRGPEIALKRANFLAALAEANYRSQQIDIATYGRALEEAYGGLDLKDDPEGLCEKAEALMSYSAALHATREKPFSTARWKALTAALESLTAASKLPSADNLAKIHLARGDVELLRYQLGQSPTSYEPAKKSEAILLKNAGTFYRGAEAHASTSGSRKEVQEAKIKTSLVAGMTGDIQKLKELIKMEPVACQYVLEEAVDDGLITGEWLFNGGVLNP
ncbi:MAG: hypothetical protein M1818_003524 [Claussenomyces sp. TS43310]|nr:MAG: hypothetical protein M1818_003524 [Claussenomyces sp. TS43310]